MKNYLRLAVLLLLAVPAFGQTSPAPSSTGSINASGTTCATTNACVTLPMYAVVTSVSVTVSGTFSATLQPEQSGDGINWSSAGSSISSTGVTTFATQAMVGFRIRASAYVSGTAVITITAGAGSSGSGSGGSGGSPTLDAVLNPIAAKNFTLLNSQTPSPLTFTYNGIFTLANNTQTLQAVTGGTCNYATQTGVFRVTSGISACTNTPASGTTNSQTEGISSFINENDANQGGQFGKNYAFGLFGHVTCTGATMICEGNANGVTDTASNAGVVLLGSENDVYTNNAGTTGYGYMYSHRGTVQPSNDNFPAFAVQQAPSATILATSGFKCEVGSVATSQSYASGACFLAGPVATGASQHSSSITFVNTDGSSTQHLAQVYSVWNTSSLTPLITEQASLAMVMTSLFSRNTAQVAGNIALGAGWGTTASVGTVSGYAQRMRFTVTSNGTGQASSPTITITFSDALPFAPICMAVPQGGTGTQANLFPGTESATSSGAMVWQGGSPAAGSTYIFAVDCRL